MYASELIRTVEGRKDTTLFCALIADLTQVLTGSIDKVLALTVH